MVGRVGWGSHGGRFPEAPGSRTFVCIIRKMEEKVVSLSKKK